MHWPTLFKNLMRIGLSVGVVAAIAAGFLLLNPSSESDSGLEISSSKADIAWMTPFERTHTQKFAGALEDLGHEPPRAYDLNGNDVYFSTRTSRKSPERLLQEYQHKFVEHGINSKMWMQTESVLTKMGASQATRKMIRERASAAVNGEILPQIVNKDYMSMSGMLIQKPGEDEDPDKTAQRTLAKAEKAAEQMEKIYKECDGDPDLVDRSAPAKPSAEVKNVANALGRKASCDGGGAKVCSEWRARLMEAHNQMQALKAAIERQPEMRNCPALKRFHVQQAMGVQRDFTERVHGFRSIEAFRDRKSGQTVVTASWSDGEFDMKSMLPSVYGFGDQDGRVPLCESCKRAYRFTGSGSESAYTSDEIWSNESMDRVAADYIETLAEDGWEFRDGAPMLQQLYSRMKMPAEGGKFLRFARGDEHLTLHLRADRRNNRTAITALTSN